MTPQEWRNLCRDLWNEHIDKDLIAVISRGELTARKIAKKEVVED